MVTARGLQSRIVERSCGQQSSGGNISRLLRWRATGADTKFLRKDLTSEPQAFPIAQWRKRLPRVSWAARGGAMTGRDPNSKEEKPAALRSAAVKALQSPAREVNPNKSDRLIRHALALIERARVIRQSRDRDALEGGPASSQRERPTVQTD